MTTPSGNVSPMTQPAQDAAAAPIIRTIGLSDLHQALRLGWEDFKAVPGYAIILCLIYPVPGMVLARTVLGYSVLPLLFPLAAGFAPAGTCSSAISVRCFRAIATHRTTPRMGKMP